jgi:MoaA/NifB/PqqE/SkfB family radical SAM enzyme
MPAHLEHAAGIRFGQSPIDYLMLNVPPACNYACEKCFTWANTNKIKDHLSTEETCGLVRDGAELGAKVVCVIGEGEPTMYFGSLRKRVDYRKVIDTVHSHGMISLVATNGSLLDEETVAFCYERDVSLVVSIDTLDAEEYNAFYRGQADLEKVLRNMEHARKVFAQDTVTMNGTRVHRLGVHMTVTTKNYHLIPQVQQFCGDDVYFDCDAVAPVGIATENPEIYGNKEEDQYALCVRASQNATRPMVQTKASCGKDSCCLFYYGLAVGYEGEVMIDTHAIETKFFVGRIGSAPLKDLLAKAQSYRDVYFDEFGEHPCIIRNVRYRDYLTRIEGIRAQDPAYAARSALKVVN